MPMDAESRVSQEPSGAGRPGPARVLGIFQTLTVDGLTPPTMTRPHDHDPPSKIKSHADRLTRPRRLRVSYQADV